MAHFSLSMVASAAGLHHEAIAAGRRAAELASDTPQIHTALAAARARAGQQAAYVPLDPRFSALLADGRGAAVARRRHRA